MKLFGIDTGFIYPTEGAQIEDIYCLDIHGLQCMIPVPCPFFWCHQGAKMPMCIQAISKSASN